MVYPPSPSELRTASSERSGSKLETILPNDRKMTEEGISSNSKLEHSSSSTRSEQSMSYYCRTRTLFLSLPNGTLRCPNLEPREMSV